MLPASGQQRGFPGEYGTVGFRCAGEQHHQIGVLAHDIVHDMAFIPRQHRVVEAKAVHGFPLRIIGHRARIADHQHRLVIRLHCVQRFAKRDMRLPHALAIHGEPAHRRQRVFILIVQLVAVQECQHDRDGAEGENPRGGNRCGAACISQLSTAANPTPMITQASGKRG